MHQNMGQSEPDRVYLSLHGVTLEILNSFAKLIAKRCMYYIISNLLVISINVCGQYCWQHHKISCLRF